MPSCRLRCILERRMAALPLGRVHAWSNNSCIDLHRCARFCAALFHVTFAGDISVFWTNLFQYNPRDSMCFRILPARAGNRPSSQETVYASAELGDALSSLRRIPEMVAADILHEQTSSPAELIMQVRTPHRFVAIVAVAIRS